MKKQPIPVRTRTIIMFVSLFLVFLLNSFWLEGLGYARHTDFSHYWQAGRMLLFGKDVYDSHEWQSERARYGITSSGTESTFLYPLPMVILLMPFGLLTVEYAYIIWVLLGEVSILISILILSSNYLKRSFGFELLVIGTVFLFRPTLYIIPSGQITAELLLLLVLSIYSFSKEKWFYGGLAASMIILKPSLGIPFLILLGIWLLLKKQWNALMGIVSGGILLYGVGILYDPLWAISYLTIGGVAFDKYFGFQPTIWGVAGLIFKASWLKLLAGIMGACVILVVTGYFVAKRNLYNNPFRVVAILVAVVLLISPYAWNYELVLLVIPILYILIAISSSRGDLKATLFSFSLMGLSISLYLIAVAQGYDVWSSLVSGIVLGIMLFLPNHVDMALASSG